jgi:GNAT superfamily N-acetyltransferase
LIERWTTGSGGFLGEVSLVEPDEWDAKTYARKGVELLEMTDVYVHPLRRGRGWARELVQTAILHADKEGLDLFLRTIAYGKTQHRRRWGALSTEELAAFYAKFGFKARKDDPRVMVRRVK